MPTPAPSSTHFIVHTDGAAKGNPGPAGIGVALYRGSTDTDPVAVVAEYIGETTNNVAEYKALIYGLTEALLRGAETVEARTDSELMARQLAGQYKVGAANIVPLYEQAKKLMGRFEKARVVHIPREQNAVADRLANKGVAAKDKPKQGPKPAAITTAPASPKPAAAAAPATPPSADASKSWPFRHAYSRTVGEEEWAWDVEKLWEAAESLPVRPVPLSKVSSILDEDCWFGSTPPTIRRVANHARRIYEADLSHPIILSADGTLMDGGHRVAKAFLEGLKELPAVRFDVDPEPDMKRPKG
jgi:ribonuclease HI